jgi:protein-disulfide isomerase
MASKLSITYTASRDLLGLVSEEEYQKFRDLLLEAFQAEWPDATVAIEDDEEALLDLDGISGQAAQDVRDRVGDIVADIIETAEWQDEAEDFLDEEDELDDEEEKDEY